MQVGCVSGEHVLIVGVALGCALKPAPQVTHVRLLLAASLLLLLVRDVVFVVGGWGFIC